MKKPQTSETYDLMYSSEKAHDPYSIHYSRSPYYPMYRAVLRALKKADVRAVLEIGCGSGAFAHLLFDRSSIQYCGFDFSRIAIEKAQARTGRVSCFQVGDALESERPSLSGASIVCTEVLEHIPDDRKLVASWPVGTRCFCSVPNYDSQYHERFFKSESEVAERYGDLIEISEIRRVRKPIIDDLALPNLIRHIRWNRYRPKRLVELAGFGDFDKIGGWFVFHGVRI